MEPEAKSSMYEALAAVNNFLMPQVELMRRDINNLHRENKKLICTLCKLGIHHSSTDKLETIPISPPAVTKLLGPEKTKNRTESKNSQRHMNVDQSIANPEPMDMEPALPKKPRGFGAMNIERKRLIERYKYNK